MSRPKRIQLRRTKGWRKPEGAIVVARPSRWGNWYKPMRVGDKYPLGKHRNALPNPKAWIVVEVDKWGHRTGAQWGGFVDQAEATAFAVELHARAMRATRADLDGLSAHAHYLAPLVGHDLACWCPLDQPCHADVLLELANGGEA